MKLIKYNFTAPAGAHFGQMKTAAQIVSEIPNPVDTWTADAASVTQVGGLVTTWRGKGGRTLSQANATRQPVLQGSELLFGDGAGANKAVMSLDGTPIGPVSDLTIALQMRLPTAAITADLHQVLGQGSPVFRLSYRYTNSNNYLRMDQPAPVATNIDADLAAGVTSFYAIMVLTGGTSAKLHSPAATGAATLGAAPDLQALHLGNIISTSGDWPGWIGKFGIWKTAVDATQLSALRSWLS